MPVRSKSEETKNRETQDYSPHPYPSEKYLPAENRGGKVGFVFEADQETLWYRIVTEEWQYGKLTNARRCWSLVLIYVCVYGVSKWRLTYRNKNPSS